MEKPILFNTDMVKAILEGRKTCTRRIIKSQPKACNHEQYEGAEWKNEPTQWGVDEDGHYYCTLCGNGHSFAETTSGIKGIKLPYKIGDVLWVRETWQEWTDGYAYKVGGNYPQSFIDKWKPSIHMPRAAARIFLRVSNIRIERLQDISEEDAIKEGCNGVKCEKEHDYTLDESCGYCNNSGYIEPPQLQFLYLWDSVYAKQGNGWSDNPWVWVIEFERV